MFQGRPETAMPTKETTWKAKKKLRQGKSASTAAGEFVREEMHHIREGKHGARSSKQAIAIWLSKARRAGAPLKPPRIGKTGQTCRRQAHGLRKVSRSSQGCPNSRDCVDASEPLGPASSVFGVR
jgi:hypothetical protein